MSLDFTDPGVYVVAMMLCFLAIVVLNAWNFIFPARSLGLKPVDYKLTAKVRDQLLYIAGKPSAITRVSFDGDHRRLIIGTDRSWTIALAITTDRKIAAVDYVETWDGSRFGMGSIYAEGDPLRGVSREEILVAIGGLEEDVQWSTLKRLYED